MGEDGHDRCERAQRSDKMQMPTYKSLNSLTYFLNLSNDPSFAGSPGTEIGNVTGRRSAADGPVLALRKSESLSLLAVCLHLSMQDTVPTIA